jgi:antirestriction protein ArdC
MVADLGWAFEYETITGGANGYTTLDGSKRVVVRDDMDPAAQAKTALHELGHVLLHSDTATGQRATDGPASRNVQELEAESVAYVVAGALGLDTTDYSIGYLASWSKDDSKAVAATAERVLGAAQRILSAAFPLIEDDEDDAE